MHVAATDALLVSQHPEPIGDVVIAGVLGDRKPVRDGRRSRDRQQSRVAGFGRLGHDATLPGEFVAHLVAMAEHPGRRLDLTRGQLQLQIDAALAGSVRDVEVLADRLPTVGVDEKKLFFNPDSGNVRISS